jgi:hypothetical protein
LGCPSTTQRTPWVRNAGADGLCPDHLSNASNSETHVDPTGTFGVLVGAGRCAEFRGYPRYRPLETLSASRPVPASVRQDARLPPCGDRWSVTSFVLLRGCGVRLLAVLVKLPAAESTKFGCDFLPRLALRSLAESANESEEFIVVVSEHDDVV